MYKNINVKFLFRLLQLEEVESPINTFIIIIEVFSIIK